MTDIPRRNDLLRNTPAELAIRAAVTAVEQMPADTRLTNAVVLLLGAHNQVADFVDGIEDAGKAAIVLTAKPEA